MYHREIERISCINEVAKAKDVKILRKQPKAVILFISL